MSAGRGERATEGRRLSEGRTLVTAPKSPGLSFFAPTCAREMSARTNPSVAAAAKGALCASRVTPVASAGPTAKAVIVG